MRTKAYKNQTGNQVNCQKDFLKNFITKITKLRSEVKTNFGLRLFKLFPNSTTFGKFMGKTPIYVSDDSYFPIFHGK